jgi:hypothetical protein
MSSPDKASGPQLAQDVLCNNSGTLVPGEIWGINANGSVNLVYFDANGATSVSAVNFDPNMRTGKCAYPGFV